MKVRIKYGHFSIAVLSVLSLFFQNCSEFNLQEQGLSDSGESLGSKALSSSAKNTFGYEVGGSNYCFYDIGNGTFDITLRPVVGTYDLNPSLVQSQIAEMASHGQKNITLVMWINDLQGLPTVIPYVYGHTIDMSSGALRPQHAANLAEILKIVEDQGFHEVRIRFMMQGNADPYHWVNGFNEEAATTSFVLSTVELVEQKMANSPVRVRYDLGGELGDTWDEEVFSRKIAFMKNLWAAYIKLYPPEKSVGFSTAGTYRMAAIVEKVYDAVGVRPGELAFDIYPPIATAMEGIASTLVTIGAPDMSIVIQEFPYNDMDSFNILNKARLDLGLNIRTVIQWAYDSANPDRLFLSTSEYSYIPTPTVNTPLGAGCDAKQCVYATGTDLCFRDGITYVTIANEDWTSNLAVSIPANCANGKDMSFEIPADILTTQKIVNLVVQNSSRWTNVLLDLTQYALPQIQTIGPAGGKNAVFATGSNLCLDDGKTYVTIANADWTENLAVNIPAACGEKGTQISFQIPAKILNSQATVHFVISNSVKSVNVSANLGEYNKITGAGLGCDQNQCMWITATNVGAQCAVGIYAPDWSSQLATITMQDISCTSSGATFTIPDWIRSKYSSVIVNYQNLTDGTWSSPMLVSIVPPGD